MFDFGIGTSELLLIAMVLLIVVGPKELPGLLRTIGQWVGKVKALASEFQGHLDSLAEESGVKQVKEKVEKDIGDLSIEDLDREFAEIEKEMREQLAEGARATSGPKEARDEDLVEEEERPLPKTLDLDADAQDAASHAASARDDAAGAAEAGSATEATGDEAAAGADDVQSAGTSSGARKVADAGESASQREAARSKVAAGE